MKVCPSCGSELAEELGFCPADGSPLLSKEATENEGPSIGEETVVMPDDGGIGDATVVMSHDETTEEETVAPDRSDDSAEFGDATIAMSSPPGMIEDEPRATEESIAAEDIPSTPDDTMYRDSAGGDTQDWSSGAVGDESFSGGFDETSSFEEDVVEEDWEEDDPAPFADEIAAASASPGKSETNEKRAIWPWIVGVLLLFASFVVLIAAGFGVWWYMASTDTGLAAANTNENVAENANTEEDGFPDDGLDADLEEEANSNADTSDSSEEDDSPDDVRATPSPGRSPSPSRSPSRVEITRPSPGSTPRPTRTSTPTPTPPRATPTQNVPSRISRGVVNGQAVRLPRPAYPSAARAVNAKGSVTVRVVIDRSGNVISARAVNGHPLLRAPAVAAARRAKFRPTLLSGQPVEVAGSIVYNFQ